MRIDNKTTNAVLCITALLMLWLCVESIMSPMKFDEARTARETAVKQRLMTIRAAENRFKLRHGTYCGSVDALVSGGYIADSVAVIPYSGGRKFEITTGVIATKAGKPLPMMLCGAKYDDYLNGLNSNAVANLNAEAAEAGRFPGLKFGDIETPNGNAGNWE